eukprot:COSAG01_NODE_496_length_16290_cov_48.639244_12_plen_226_part_00
MTQGRGTRPQGASHLPVGCCWQAAKLSSGGCKSLPQRASSSTDWLRTARRSARHHRLCARTGTTCGFMARRVSPSAPESAAFAQGLVSRPVRAGTCGRALLWRSSSRRGPCTLYPRAFHRPVGLVRSGCSASRPATAEGQGARRARPAAAAGPLTRAAQSARAQSDARSTPRRGRRLGAPRTRRSHTYTAGAARPQPPLLVPDRLRLGYMDPGAAASSQPSRYGG